MAQEKAVKIAVIGAGTIGLSFVALHLSSSHNATIAIYDKRDDIHDYVNQTLPRYFEFDDSDTKTRVSVGETLEATVVGADIVQEQGPENLEFKSAIWPEIEKYAPQDALFWSSTSGIPASAQSRGMRDKSRLMVVHPYNPPHIMPLLEVVPSPSTSEALVERTLEYWRRAGRSPVLIKEECTGFVANRLAFALFREAIHLADSGVVSVQELDDIVQTSMGPRWSVAGPFKSYHAGGGKGGLEAFFNNIGGTVQECWDSSGRINVGDGWEKHIFEQTQKAYGEVNVAERDRITKRVLEVIGQEKTKS